MLMFYRKRPFPEGTRAEGANEKRAQIENRILDDPRGIQFI
jgi:hypothetical protein